VQTLLAPLTPFAMAIELTPLPLPASADPSKFVDFGREVKGVDPGNLTPEQFAEVYDALYKVRLTATSSNSKVIHMRCVQPAQRSPFPECVSHPRAAVCLDQGNGTCTTSLLVRLPTPISLGI